MRWLILIAVFLLVGLAQANIGTNSRGSRTTEEGVPLGDELFGHDVDNVGAADEPARTTGDATCSTTGNCDGVCSSVGWEACVETTANANEVVLLNAGTYSASDDIIAMQASVTLYPNNQAAVTLDGEVQMATSSVVAGLTINPALTRAQAVSASGADSWILRNNTIRGGTQDGVAVTGNSTDWSILRNDIDGGESRDAVRVSSCSTDLLPSMHSTIEGNLIEHDDLTVSAGYNLRFTGHCGVHIVTSNTLENAHASAEGLWAQEAPSVEDSEVWWSLNDFVADAGVDNALGRFTEPRALFFRNRVNIISGKHVEVGPAPTKAGKCTKWCLSESHWIYNNVWLGSGTISILDAPTIRFGHNTVRGSHTFESGQVGNLPDYLHVVNNIFSGTTFVENVAPTKCENNVFHSTTGTLTGCTSSQTGDPLFTDINDYDISMTSSAVDNGSDYYGFMNDVEGSCRPKLGTKPDIGAFEVGSTVQLSSTAPRCAYGVQGVANFDTTGATSVTAPSSIQTAINAGSAGDVFLLSGRFVQQTITPKNNQRFVFADGALMDGAERMITSGVAESGFTCTDIADTECGGSNCWEISGPDATLGTSARQFGGFETNACEGTSGNTSCDLLNNLYTTSFASAERPMVRESAASGVNSTDDYFWDHTNDKIIVNQACNSGDWYFSSTDHAVDANGIDGVTIQNATFARYSPQYQDGMIECIACEDWTIEYSDLFGAHSSAFNFDTGADRLTLRRNRIENNGQGGIMIRCFWVNTNCIALMAEDDLLTGNYIVHNGDNPVWKTGWEGTLKLSFTGTPGTVSDPLNANFGGLIMRDNFFEDNDPNDGNGAWWDIDNFNAIGEYNNIKNGKHCLFWEISARVLWRYNDCENTQRNNGAFADFWAAGNLLSNGGPAEIYGNYSYRDEAGHKALDSSGGRSNFITTPVTVEYLTIDVYIHHNIVRYGAGHARATRFGTGFQNGGSQTDAVFFSGHSIDQNLYCEFPASPSDIFQWQGGNQTFATWQAGGRDSNGNSVTTSCPTKRFPF